MSRKNVSDLLVCVAQDYWSRRNANFENRPPEKWSYELLSDWTGEPWKVCYRAMERASANGLLDYGVSLRCGWVTDKGMKLLEDNCPDYQI